MVWLSVLQGMVGIEGWAVLGKGRVVRAAGEESSLEKKEKDPPFARSKTALRGSGSHGVKGVPPSGQVKWPRARVRSPRLPGKWDR
jgi:hypothetical protein